MAFKDRYFFAPMLQFLLAYLALINILLNDVHVKLNNKVIKSVLLGFIAIVLLVVPVLNTNTFAETFKLDFYDSDKLFDYTEDRNYPVM